mgnify:CR=1 FL=1
MNNVQLTKNRHSLIMHLIKNWRTGKAWEFFNQLRANMLARTEHYVQILSICDDAHYIKFLIDEMRENQHIVGKVNLQCYKYFTQQLLIECFDVEDVKQIISNQLEIDGYTGQEKAHKVLNCRGVTRSDFKFFRNIFYLLEINTQPGMTSLSLVPEIANYNGISFENLVEKILLDASINK